jgi:hypothetical protein
MNGRGGASRPLGQADCGSEAESPWSRANRGFWLGFNFVADDHSQRVTWASQETAGLEPRLDGWKSIYHYGT